MKLWVVLAIVGGCADDGGPRLTSVTPSVVVAGDVVQIAGSRFCGKSGDCMHVTASLQLGTSSPYIDAVPTSWSDTLVTAVIPQAAPLGKTPLVMTVDGLASNEVDLSIMGAQ